MRMIEHARMLERERDEWQEQAIHYALAYNGMQEVTEQRDRLAEALRHTIERINNFEEYIAGSKPAPPATSAALEFAAEALQSLTNNKS